jgi:hypothetical protein
MRLIQQWLCVAGLAASALAATSDTPPNVIVDTLDTTLRRMAFLVRSAGTPWTLWRGSRPFYARLRPGSTYASVARDDFHGHVSRFHQTSDFPMPLIKDLPLPRYLRARGYHTAALHWFVGARPSGGAQVTGFDTYFADFIRKTSTKGSLQDR